MGSYIPGRISMVEMKDDYVTVTIQNLGDNAVTIRITDVDPNMVWAACQYWEAIKAHGEQILYEIEDELREQNAWDEDED